MTEVPPPPAYPAPAASGPKNWMGIVALIGGILGVLAACCALLAPGLGVLPSAAGIVLGLLGKKADAAGEATNGKLANIGFILGIVGAVLAVLSVIVFIIFAATGAVADYSY